MLNDVFETVVKGSNTVFLDIPEKDYFLSYNSIDDDSAQDLSNVYFSLKGKDGIPVVRDVILDPVTKLVKITLEVEQQRDFKLESYTVPDIFNRSDKL